MVKTLYLIRHAEAAYAAGGTDLSRPLTKRGAKHASRLGRVIKALNWKFDSALYSPALRTRQTWELLGGGGPALEDGRLYRGEAVDYLDVLKEIGREADGLILTGHNPSCSEFVMRLPEPNDKTRQNRHGSGGVVQSAVEKTEQEIENLSVYGGEGARGQFNWHGFLPGSLAVIRFAVTEWPMVDFANGTLDFFICAERHDE